MTDILPSSDKNYDDIVNDSIDDHSSVQFESIGYKASVLDKFERRLFPDRFGPDTSCVYRLTNEKDTIYYHKWLYEDSVKVMNAFYNWIDCFGENCKSMFLGDERNFQKEAMMILVSDTTLLFIEGGNLNFKSWYTYHNNLGYDQDYNYTIEQRHRGRARWFTFEDKKKIKYEKK